MIKNIIKNNTPSLILSVLFGWAEVVFTVQALLMIGGLLEIAVGQVQGNLSTYIVKTVFYVAMMFSMGVAHSYFLQIFSKNSVATLRKSIVQKLFNRPTIVFNKRTSDEYIGILETDIEQLRMYYFRNIPSILNGIGQVAIYAIALLRFNFLIFIVSAVVSLLPMFINKLFVKPLNKVQLERSEKNSFYLEKLNETINGYSTIKRSNNYSKFVDILSKVDEDKLETVKKANVFQTIAFQGLFSANFISIGSIVLVGSILVSRGQMQIAEVVAAMNIISTGSNSLASLLRSFLEFRSTKDLMKKVLGNSSEETENEEVLSLKSVNMPISIQNLDFSFGNRNIFRDFDFIFHENKSYGIVGDSGSGKTTLARMLLKEIDNFSGNIKYGNDSVIDIKEESLYESVDYIPQNPFIFRDTLKNNITLYSDYNEDKFMDILGKVNIIDLLKRCKDEKLNPLKLSGGEKQRIAIARSLYKDSDLIIFDEPTSGLDPENRENIDNLIFSLKDRTKIVITHNWDKDYLSKFDKVIKIGNGGEEFIL